MTKITDEVLAEIKSGKVQMHPDWYFALLATGFGTAVAFGLLLAVYSLNLMLLRLQIAHGTAGARVLGRYYFDAHHIPWLFIIMTVLAIAGVVWLLRHRSDYAKQLPEWSLAVGVVIFVLCLGFGLSLVRLDRPLEHSRFFRNLYEEPGERPERPIYRQPKFDAPLQNY